MMYRPWHHDQRAQDDAEERAARELDAAEEADVLARLEAHADTTGVSDKGPGMENKDELA